MFRGVSIQQITALLEAKPCTKTNGLLTGAVTGISTDSRQLQPGEIFVALRGETFDGHRFVEAAFQQGAVAAIVEDPSIMADDRGLLLVVPNTLVAYQAIARWWREQFTIPVIAVTGSVGKTTTKELIAAVLATQGTVLKTQANYNNEIGVPKTLLELDSQHDYAVIEMGMRGPGEIALLTQISRPDIAVITNVGTAHIGRLGSEAAIAQAKCELLAETAISGIAILNHDDQRLLDTATQVWRGKTVTYGLDGGDLRGDIVEGTTLVVEGLAFPLPLPGRHNALNYLAALAVAKVLQIDWLPLTQGLTVQLPKGRAHRYDLANDIVILDETYNAGLESMIAALHLLAETPGKRHIAILGTMKELGSRSPEFHHQVGLVVNQLGLDALLILADPAESQALASGANPVPSYQFTDEMAVVQWLAAEIRPGDRLLFKASRAVGLERVVDELIRTIAPQIR
jgi:UDP-N-acetylmuramoyl-tripeptide--D-alanyl-D-alanine ligase